jgi:hypothetical protein
MIPILSLHLHTRNVEVGGWCVSISVTDSVNKALSLH